MDRLVKNAVVLSLLVLTPALMAQAPHWPRGVYTKVEISSMILDQQQANPAISGLEISVHWGQVNPNPPTSTNPNFGNYRDDGFNQAAAWNAQNPTQAPKTIQLIVTPGFNSPQGMLAQIPSCDGLFQTPSSTPPSTCGKGTFTGDGEVADGSELPLPWNPFYKSVWQTFVTVLAARYGQNPTLVSIAVEGPTAASPEMQTASNTTAANPQTQFGVSISPNDMWS